MILARKTQRILIINGKFNLKCNLDKVPLKSELHF